MPVDENTRLRIRQYLIELMDESAADAMMESMPPIPWTQLATKDDIALLDRRLGGVEDRLGGVEGRIGGVEGRIEALTLRADQTSSDLQELTRLVAAQGASLSSRMDSLSMRMDSIGERIDVLGGHMSDLGRAVTIGAATMAVMLAVFVAGTITSLLASGALG
ncbi:MAG: hypothetical protein R2707_14425 [Acidimicrobiales bacterium]